MTVEDAHDVADALERVADLLEVQGASAFRVRAYRAAAGTLRGLDEPLSLIVARDDAALEQLPGIGERLARAIREIVSTGRLRFLERLEGEVSPEELLRTVPGIGRELAHRIHADLDVDTLEELEVAAHDGRLEALHGFGPRRVEAVRHTLAGMLAGAGRRRALARRGPSGSSRSERIKAEPSVEALLSVDREYREKAARDALHRIAPRRFNPEGQAWLPILHTEREGWHMTVLFSNTARAHELGRTRDWVVIYADGDGTGERRYTVVTEYQGDLAGRRVVRGRELECRRHLAPEGDVAGG